MIEKRIALNTLYLYVRMLLVMGVTLFTSRVVLRELGAVDYGIYNVVAGVVTMMSFLNTALANGYQRFFNIALGSNNYTELQRIFSSSLAIQLLMILLSVFVCETLGLWFLNYEMSIPTDRIVAANWVYQMAILMFCTTLFRVPFHAVIISFEKMNIFAYISIVEVIMQLALVYLLYLFNCDKLIVYSILMAILNIGVMLSYIICAKSSDKFLSFKPHIEKSYIRQLLSFSGWNIFGTLAHLLRSNGINILLNIFFTPLINAANGFASQVLGGVSTLAQNVITASRPQIMKHYAKNNLREMFELTYSVSRYVFCLLWVMSFPIIVNINFVFALWLGKETPMYTQYFTVLVLIFGLIDAFSSSLATLVHATGNLKKFQIWVSIVLISLIPISYFVLKLGAPPQSVFYVSIVLGCLAQAVRLIILKELLPAFSILTYCKKVIMPIFLLVITSIVVIYLPYRIFLYHQAGIINLIVVVILSCTLTVLIGLTQEERRLLLSKIFSFISVKKSC